MNPRMHSEFVFLRYNSSRFMKVILLALLLISLGTCLNAFPSAGKSARQAEKTAPPAEVTAVVSKAFSFVNRHEPEALAEISTPEASKTEEWVRSTSTAKWEVGAVAPSPREGSPDPGWLIVFHAWHSCETDFDHIYHLEKTDRGWMIGEEQREDDPAGYRIRDNEISVHADVDKKSVSFADRVRVEHVGDRDPGFAIMHISPDFKVTDIRTSANGGEEKPAVFQQTGGVITVQTPEAKTFNLTLKYSGILSRADGDFVHSDEVSLASYWYPTIARLPATSTTIVETPKGWSAVGQGELQSTDNLPDGAHRYTFHNQVPVSFFSLDMGKYTVTSKDVDGHKLYVYLLDPDRDLANRCIDVVAKSMRFYESHFGAFPYTRYSVVQSHWATEMALEAYSFATFGPRSLPDLIPHELSHTWWGGAVDNSYLHSMWNEAMADYSDNLFHRMTGDGEGRPTQDALFREYRQSGHSYDAAPVAKSFDTLDRTSSAIGYDKGSKVLRVLEDEIGQEQMLRSVAAFYTSHPVGEAVEWSDFIAAVNKTTGKDCNWFFDQWLERKGLPQIRLDGVNLNRTDSGGVVAFDVVQFGKPYRLSLEISVRLATGEKLVTMQVSGMKTHIEIPVDAVPVSLTLNPRGIIPLCPTQDGDPEIDFTTYRFNRN